MQGQGAAALQQHMSTNLEAGQVLGHPSGGPLTDTTNSALLPKLGKMVYIF